MNVEETVTLDSLDLQVELVLLEQLDKLVQPVAQVQLVLQVELDQLEELVLLVPQVCKDGMVTQEILALKETRVLLVPLEELEPLELLARLE